MAKVVDITEKLSFEENPILKVKDVELEVNADAETVLKIMGTLGSVEDITPNTVVEMCDLIFTEESKEKIKKLKLNFADYQTVVMCAIDLIVGDDGEEVGELTTLATT